MSYKEKECKECNLAFAPFVHNQSVCDGCSGKDRLKPCKLCDTLFKPTTVREDYCGIECRNAQSMIGRKRAGYYTKKAYLKFKEIDKCQICGLEGFTMQGGPHSQKLCLDHKHGTDFVRGKLCHNCNRGLGLFQDNPELLKVAATYLEGAETIRKEYTQVSGSA